MHKRPYVLMATAFIAVAVFGVSTIIVLMGCVLAGYLYL